MAPFDRLPVCLVESILLRLPVTCLRDLRECSSTVGEVSPESFTKCLHIPLDEMDIARSSRNSRLTKMGSLERLELVGSGSSNSLARQESVEQLRRNDHQLTAVVFVLSRLVRPLPLLASVELADVTSQTVLAGASCFLTSCPTVSTVRLRNVLLQAAGSFDMLCTLLGALPRLQTLDLRECALPSRSDFQHLGALQSLRIIERSTPMVFYRVQVYLEKLPALVKVCVFVCPAIHSDGPAYRISNSRRVD